MMWIDVPGLADYGISPRSARLWSWAGRVRRRYRLRDGRRHVEYHLEDLRRMAEGQSTIEHAP